MRIHIESCGNYCIDEILEKHDIVLLDTGVTTSRNTHSWYEDHVFYAKYFSQLDSNLLSEVCENVETAKRLFLNPKIVTTEGVAYEIANHGKIAKDKLSWLRQREKLRSRKDKMRQDDYDFYTALKANSLADVCFSLHKFHKDALKKIFNPDDRNKYNEIEKMVMNVVNNSGIKRESFSVYGEMGKFFTDEQLVASALYLSIVDNKNTAIISTDSDIPIILLKVKEYCSLENRCGCKVLEKLCRNPIQPYLISKNNKVGIAVETFDNNECIDEFSDERIKTINSVKKSIEDSLLKII
ncbi:MAG: hypothetical protein ABIH25_03795 [Candidatus Woesearchaeota archaeon]